MKSGGRSLMTRVKCSSAVPGMRSSDRTGGAK